MLFYTKGIILKAVKFSETTIIATIYTDQFGLQQYKIPGVRKVAKKGLNKGVYFQPAAILNIEVYNNETKKLQYIKEFSWGYLYHYTFFDVIKNAICNYLVEIVLNTISQPEQNHFLYIFLENLLIDIDQSNKDEIANIPIFFLLKFAAYLGIEIENNTNEDLLFLDLKQGIFVANYTQDIYHLDAQYTAIIKQFIKSNFIAELKNILISKKQRLVILQFLQLHYSLHGKDITHLKTLPILQQVLR